MRPTNYKNDAHLELERKTEEFLARGGKVNEVPHSASADYRGFVGNQRAATQLEDRVLLKSYHARGLHKNISFRNHDKKFVVKKEGVMGGLFDTLDEAILNNYGRI